MGGVPRGPLGKAANQPSIDPGTLIRQASSPKLSVGRHGPGNSLKGPILVGESKKRPGYDYKKGAYVLAEDMMSADQPAQAVTLRKEKVFSLSDEDLSSMMRKLLSRVSTGKLNEVAMDMLAKFCKGSGSRLPGPPPTSAPRKMRESWYRGIGGTYRSEKLDAAIADNGAMASYHNAFFQELNAALRYSNYNPAKFILQMDSDSLAFTSFSDEVGGLGITVNQVWAVKAELQDYSTDSAHWQGDLVYTLYDHFGLDWTDIKTKGDWIKPFAPTPADLFRDVAITGGNCFKAWYILQHFRRARPFITEMKTKKRVGGPVS